MKKIGRNDPCLCGSGKKYKFCCLRKDTTHAGQLPSEDVAIPVALQVAIEHHQGGRLPQAEAIYQQVLQVQPNHPDALHLLGDIFRQRGNIEIAVDLIDKAIDANPGEQIYYNSLGNVLQVQGRLDAAIESYRKALRLKPDYAEAYSNLGNVLLADGRPDEAVGNCRKALLIKPDYAEAYGNLGNALLAQGRPDEAVESYRRALLLKPDYAEAYNNLGTVLLAQGRSDDAVESYRKALLIKPDQAEVYCNLGHALLAQSRPDEAVESYRQALLLKPGYAEAYSNLGTALQVQGRPDEAVENYRQALLIKPDYAEAYSNLLFCLIHDDRLTPEACRDQHLAFAERFEGPLRAGWQSHPNDRNPDRRLKIGFVSGDLRSHPVANFIEPVWAALASGMVDLWVYSSHSVEDDVTSRLRRLVSNWRLVVGLSDAALADAIRADGIDILIDLSGHTGHNRLLTFARKPAPVQATWIGYPGTTGLTAIDYLICDRFNAPHGLYEQYYSERFARLPSTGAFEPNQDAPAVNELPALTNGYITFASFNRPSKLGEPVVAAWSRILHALPSARLLLSHVSDETLAEGLKARFGRHGIAPGRLRFQPRLPMSTYLALHHEVDVVLDTWPFTGGTTTNHALWMGVPVVTLRGPSRAHCQSAAALCRMGLEDWVADDAAGFVHIAIERAQDIDALAALRRGMRERWLNSPWRQSTTVAQGLEAALRMMWQRWCAGLPVEDFEVPVKALGRGRIDV